MFWFLVLNIIARVASAYDYYSDIDWSSSNQQQEFQQFHPSSKYDLTHPTPNMYGYAGHASNYLEPEDLFGTESIINEDVDRQVNNPVEGVGPVIEGLTPFIVTSAFILGISALFANVVNLNSSASNASVPFGLFALPELPQITNISLPNIGGRKKRDTDNVSWYEDVFGLNNEMEPSVISNVFKMLSDQNPERIFNGFRAAVKMFALMDDNTDCQAAFGCR